MGTMTPAAKEKNLALSLATGVPVSPSGGRKTHQGSKTSLSYTHQAVSVLNLQTALGMTVCVRRNGNGVICYGEEITSTNNDTYKFAQTYRDSDSGLDYANSRFYVSGIGRFLTADKVHANPDPSQPQNWNRYAYSMGDPINRADVSGKGSCSLDLYGTTASLDVTCDPECDPDEDVCPDTSTDWDSSPGPIEPTPAAPPCSITAQSILGFMDSTKAYTAQGQPIASGSEPMATLAFAQDILADAIADNVDPRLLVAVSFVEGKWGGDAAAGAKDNSFGLHNSSGGLANFTNAGGWAASIQAAANALQAHITAGQTSVGSLYSGNNSKTNGGLAAYCVGPNCSKKSGAVSKKLAAQGGNASSLTSPCYQGPDGKYYQKQ
jgi:RHS repeat-associated protein